MNDLDVSSFLLGLVTTLPAGLVALWLMTWLEHRRTPKWNDWQKTGLLR